MTKTCRKAFFFAALLLATTIRAETRPGLIQLWDFSGGLNITTNWPLLQDNQLQTCWNLVLDDPIGAARPRPGFHSVTGDLSDRDRIYSIHGYRGVDRAPVLFQVIGRTDVNWCDLWASSEYGYEATDSISSQLATSTTNVWVSWNQDHYLFSSQSDPLIVSGKPADYTCRSLIPPAPGALTAVPTKGTGKLNDGIYVYAVMVRRYQCYDPGDTIAWPERPSAISTPVKTVGTQNVLLSGFWPVLPDRDSACATYGGDSCDIWILRSERNKIAPGDSLYGIRILTRITEAEADTLRVVDSTATPGAFVAEIPVYGFDMDYDYRVLFRDERSYTTGIVCYDTSYSTSGSGDTLGIGNSDSSYMAIYALVYRDTLSGAVGNLGPPKAIHFLHTDFDGVPIRKIRLLVPPVIAGPYRQLLLRYDAYREFGTSARPWEGLYYIIDSLENTTETYYTDSLGHTDMALNCPVFVNTALAALLRGAIVHEDRMWTWDDRYVYVSRVDTAGAYDDTNSYAFDWDDGDEIVGLGASEGQVLAYKANSRWEVQTVDGEVVDQRKAAWGVGMIAPASLIYYQGYQLVLDRLGVAGETQNLYRANSPQRTRLSDPVKSLLVRTSGTMRSAVGFAVGDWCLFTYPGTDSSFVYFPRTGGWSLWGFDFTCATEYDTTAGSTFEGMVFVQDNSDRVFVLDPADSTDNGSEYNCVLAKNYLDRDAWRVSQPLEVAIQQESDVQTADSLLVLLTDENGDTLALVNIDSLDAGPYRRAPIAPAGNATFRHLNVQLTIPARPNLRIVGLEIETGDAGEY